MVATTNAVSVESTIQDLDKNRQAVPFDKSFCMASRSGHKKN